VVASPGEPFGLFALIAIVSITVCGTVERLPVIATVDVDVTEAATAATFVVYVMAAVAAAIVVILGGEATSVFLIKASKSC
jgi:hypothetical protein